MEKASSKSFRTKIILTLITLSSVFLFRIIPSEIPYLDKKGDEYFSSAIKKAVVAYATVRVTNALVSIVKETEVEITPLGLGVTVHIGEFLDPIDDATERLSVVLTSSIAVLGLMKITKELLSIYTFKVLSYFMLLLIPGIWTKVLNNFSRNLLGIIILLLAIRFSLPVCGIINDFLYKDYFEPQINNSLQKFHIVEQIMEEYQKQLDSIISENQEPLDESGQGSFFMYQENPSDNEKGFLSGFSSIKRYFSQIVDYLDSIKSWITSAFEDINKKKEELLTLFKVLWDYKGVLVEALTSLVVLYLSLTVIQAVLLPLAVIWIMKQLASSFLLRI